MYNLYAYTATYVAMTMRRDNWLALVISILYDSINYIVSYMFHLIYVAIAREEWIPQAQTFGLDCE